MNNSIFTVNCPICGKAVRWVHENSFRPFCSNLCRLIDLSKWTEEENHIPGDINF